MSKKRAAARSRKNGYERLYVDIPVVPLGERLSLHGWTREQVADAIIPNTATDAVCWNCCHAFNWPSVRIPLKRDDRTAVAGNIKDLFYSRGQFCTFECAKDYVLLHPSEKNMSIMYLALIANRARHLPPGDDSHAGNAYYIRGLPNKYQLEMFGGQKRIDQYREGCMRLDGSICGYEDDLIELMLPRKFRREHIEPPAFIDKSIVTIVRCETVAGQVTRCNNGKSVFPNTNIAYSGQNGRRSAAVNSGGVSTGPDLSIREKMIQSRKRREAPVASANGAQTLDSSMGVIINKKRK